MSQLQEMQITSPGVYQPNGQLNQQSSPIPIHSSSRPVMIGSLPSDQHMSHQHFSNRSNNQFYHSTSSPIATPNGSQGTSEYGTPSSTWHSSAAINPHQTLLVNTGGSQQHHSQLIPGSAPSGGYSDLVMEDLSLQVHSLLFIKFLGHRFLQSPYFSNSIMVGIERNVDQIVENLLIRFIRLIGHTVIVDTQAFRSLENACPIEKVL